jgi:hypothetical protein
MSLPTYQRHPFGQMVPEHTDDEASRQRLRLEENGWLPTEFITLYEGKIIDGWHRYLHCKKLGIMPQFVEYHGDSPMSFVFSKATGGRQLATVSLLRMAERMRPELEKEAAARMLQGGKDTKKLTDPAANLHQGHRPHSGDDNSSKSRVSDKIAEIAGVSTRTADSYHKVQTNGAAALKKAVDEGEVSISDGATVLTLPKAEQAAAVAAVRNGEARTVRAAVTKESEEDEEKELTDAEGHPVTVRTTDAFSNLDRFTAIDSLCRQLQTAISELATLPGGEHLRQCVRAVGSEEKVIYKSEHLDTLKRDLKFTRPHSVCPYCEGRGHKSCKGCSGLGWVTRTVWNDADEKVKKQL